MALFSASRITDPVHKTIGLSELEAQVISTQVFQRLRNVKQLGLANYVFPGADYSRFAHSLGVCHVTGRILDALAESGQRIEPEEIQLYRLAGLLHDIGHYPYSHTTEDALRDYYSEALLEPKQGQSDTLSIETTQEEVNFFEHERVGQEILSKDTELAEIFDNYGYKPEDVYSVFMRVKPPRFANLISSDLDADRIDYLLRTAHHTGLPYGSVDLDYFLSQMRVDEQDRICITGKALRTADHFLLSRYFDYQQVPYHKTVAALELVLKDVIAELLRQNKIQGSDAWVSESIENREWSTFDDAFILRKIEELSEDSEDEVHKLKARAIVGRKPPKLVAAREFVGARDPAQFRSEKRLVSDHKSAWASRFGIDERLWYVWPISGMALTKVGSHIPVSSSEGTDAGHDDKYEQAIRVLNEPTRESEPIMGVERSLMSILANNALYSLRVYVLLPEEMEGCREEISQFVKADLNDINWD